MSGLRTASSRGFDYLHVQNGEAAVISSYSTLRTPPEPDFPCESLCNRDRTDPEMLSQLNGLYAYVQDFADGEMTSMRYHLLRHLERTRRQISFAVKPQHLPAFADWAERANAIYLRRAMSVYDPDGVVLIDPDGRTYPHAVLPYPPDAQERKQKTLAALRAASIRTLPRMPPVLGLGEVVLRPAHDVAGRALALMLVAAHSEAWKIGRPDAIPEVRRRFSKGLPFLSGKEITYVGDRSPDEEIIHEMGWHYEALNLLLWALGMRDELSDPGIIADAAELAQASEELNVVPRSLETASLRPTGEILDALDHHYRLHWASRQARLDGHRIPGVDEAIVTERHRALNWLTGFQNVDKPWDEVDTPT